MAHTPQPWILWWLIPPAPGYWWVAGRGYLLVGVPPAAGDCAGWLIAPGTVIGGWLMPPNTFSCVADSAGYLWWLNMPPAGYFGG